MLPSSERKRDLSCRSVGRNERKPDHAGRNLVAGSPGCLNIARGWERVPIDRAHKRLDARTIVAEWVVKLHALTVEIAEVAVQLCGSWSPKEVIRCGVVAESFVGDIEERLVVPIIVRQSHWATNRSTKLVLLQRSLVWVEIVCRIQRIVSQEFPSATVELVRSRLRDNVYNPAEDLSELRLVVVGLNLKLLDVI